ncbi:hypothetical protein HCN51_35335 [Nonomuraea sp. FMUSA5-5]|uniref:Uncharacterized protein n=1 Tax=Nonomuraea composti TaxID=2720023 RepID=A0ABX1BDM1_9ACTN|nr:hypothetical protein [Nonomuraea sp. FMUSA5-5]NJP94655.1 hypothetical protein [Nonomuraea sp. FMUSA5-5]
MIPTDQAGTTEWADAIDAGPAPVQLDGPQGPVPAMTPAMPAMTPTMTNPTIDGGAAPRQGGDPYSGEIVFDTQVNDAGAAPEAPRDRDDSEARP